MIPSSDMKNEFAQSTVTPQEVIQPWQAGIIKAIKEFKILQCDSNNKSTINDINKDDDDMMVN